MASVSAFRHQDQGAVNVQVLSKYELLVWLSGYFTENEDIIAFTEMVEGRLLQGVTWLIIDMQSVEFMTSRLLAALVSCHKKFRRLGGDVMLVDVSKNVREILELTEMDHYFDVMNSVAAARLKILETTR